MFRYENRRLQDQRSVSHAVPKARLWLPIGWCSVPIPKRRLGRDCNAGSCCQHQLGLAYRREEGSGWGRGGGETVSTAGRPHPTPDSGSITTTQNEFRGEALLTDCLNFSMAVTLGRVLPKKPTKTMQGQGPEL